VLPAGGIFLPVVPQGDSFQEAQYFSVESITRTFPECDPAERGNRRERRPRQGVLDESRGTNTASSQTLPVSSHGYWSIGEYKDILLLKPSKKVDTIPTSLVGNSELIFLCFSTQGIQQRYQKRESKVLYL
jgi:hypothetical protein